MGVPLPLLIETVRSAVLLSDLLTERAQFEWLLACCVTLYQLHPIDDEIMLQYLVLGLCKAAAVLNAVSVERWGGDGGRGVVETVGWCECGWVEGGVLGVRNKMCRCRDRGWGGASMCRMWR